MDHETLQALIKVYRNRASADLLSIIMDEAEGPQSEAAVLDLLRSLPPELLAKEAFAPARRKACQFCLNMGDFELCERLARLSELPEDRALRARSLHGLGRDQEAATLYRQAILQDPAMRNRDLERLLGIRTAGTPSPAQAKVISLTSYSSRRESRSEPDRSGSISGAFLDEFDDTAVTFGDVAGLDDIKAEIRRRIILPYLKPSLFERYRQKAGGALLLFGPPGCGKTLIARATAGESDARFLCVYPEDIIDKYAGEAEKRLRLVFDEARSDTPAILFFDDFELLAFPRTGVAGEAAPALVSTFLSELHGTLRNNSGVLIIAATNAPWMLDKALFRSGHFHKVMFVPPPSFEARKKILGGAIANVPGDAKVPLDRIAGKAAGFSGADMRAFGEWVNNATMVKALSGPPDTPIAPATLEEGLKLFGPSARDWMRLARTILRGLERDEPRLRAVSHLYRY